MGSTTWKIAKPATKSSSAKRRWSIAVVVVLIAGGVGGAAWWRSAYPPEDPQVAKVKALQQRVFRSFETDNSAGDARGAAATRETSTASAPPALSPKEREAAMTELRAEMEKLTEEQRDEVRRGMGDGFRERMRATIQEFRALPEEKRTAFLDQQIDQMEKWRGQFQRGGGGGGNRDANRGGASANAPPQRGGDRNGPPSTERRSQRRREMLAGTTPQERAEAEMYFSALNARREERGLESFGFGGRR